MAAKHLSNSRDLLATNHPLSPPRKPTPFDILKTRPILLWLTWTQVVDGSWLQMFMSAPFFPRHTPTSNTNKPKKEPEHLTSLAAS
jgi:hypothetical protein